MKNITLTLFAWICSMSVFSAHYLVAPNASDWTSTVGTAVGLEGKLLDTWFAEQTFAENDRVWILAGTYELADPIVLPTKIKFSVYGGFSGTETTIAERESGAEVWAYANETILDGKGASQLIDATGADYYDGDGGKITLVDGLTLINGKAENGGAFIGNAAITIQSCRFENNEATANGGALYITGGQFVTVDKCLFSSNTAATNGGGAYIQGDRAKVTNSTFEYNRMYPGCPSNHGGGLQMSGGYDLSSHYGDIHNCIFKANYARGMGGAFSLNGVASAENCLVVNNDGDQEYGAYNSIFFVNGKIVNCTVANNKGGIRIEGDAEGREIINTIFWGNTNSYEGSSDGTVVAFKNCLTETISGSGITGWTEENTVNEDPKFVNPTSFTGLPQDAEEAELAASDWKLKEDSPAIDTGSTGGTVEDMLGNARPDGAGFDIGAYEYVEPTSVKRIESIAGYTILSLENKIEIIGLAESVPVSVYDISGKLIVSLVANKYATINLNKGIYLVNVGADVNKVVVN